MAPNDAEWQQVQNELAEKLANPNLADLHPLLERFQQLATARPFPPSYFRIFVSFIEQMNARVPQSSLGQVLSAASKQTLNFHNTGWDVETVNQAQVIFQNVVNQVRPEIKTPEPEPIRVPIVLVVMTGLEADQALDNSAFSNHPEAFRENFQRLCGELKQNGLQDWRQWYANEISDWHPHGRVQAIAQLVQDALAELQKREHYPQRLVAEFYDVHAVVNNWALLQELRKGCVVIVDSMSLRHPLIMRAFQQSLLDAYPNVSVLAIAPVSHGWDLLREMTVVLQFHLTDTEFYKRRKDAMDEGCEELTDIDRFPKEFLRRVRRWLDAAGARPGVLPKI
jgi:hypothetical protein